MVKLLIKQEWIILKVKNKIMSKAKEEVKSGLVENEVVEKAPVVKNIPVAKVEKVQEAPADPGNTTRAFRS